MSKRRNAKHKEPKNLGDNINEICKKEPNMSFKNLNYIKISKSMNSLYYGLEKLKCELEN